MPPRKWRLCEGETTTLAPVLGRLLAILGLVGLTVTQPVLDLFGSSPSTFDQFGIEGHSIIWFAVLIALVPGLVLFTINETIRLFDESAGDLTHSVMVGALATGFGVLLAKAVTSSSVLTVLIAAAIGTGVGLLYARTEAMGMWLRLMAAANVFFVAQFLLLSPAAEWIASATATPEIIAPIATAEEPAPMHDDAGDIEVTTASARPPSVFILVFDELPSQTLLSADGVIDAQQFPNFAALADDATHYRRHTTNSPFTHAAVPSLFDGKEPQGGPTWTEHPENLFNVFAGSHHLIVSEVLTRLCGFDVCANLTPPPPATPTIKAVPPDSEATATTAAPPTPSAVASATNDGPHWMGVLDATWDVWLERLNPMADTVARRMDDFQEDFGAAATTTTAAFRPPRPNPSSPVTTTAAPHDRNDSQIPTLTVPQESRSEEEEAFDRFLSLLPGAQPARLTEFLDAVVPSDQPVFGYLHLILPHQPWVVRENGELYDIAGERYDYEADNASEWPTKVGRQRHVLQTRYTDRVLGEFVAHLRDQGYYDESLIVVLGDHGVSFVPGELSRTLSEKGLPGIAYTPLLIKAPGQTEGVVDDQNVSIVDIAPTIADILGVRLPWKTVGDAAGSPEVLARGSEKQIYAFTSPTEFDLPPARSFDDEEAFTQLLAGRHPSPSLPDDPLSALYDGVAGAELRGLRASDVMGAADGSGTVEALDRLRAPGDRPLLGEVSGRVDSAPDTSTVLVAVNDVIVGVSPLYVRDGRPDSFVVLLPAGALNPSANDVRIALRSATGDIREVTIEN